MRTLIADDEVPKTCKLRDAGRLCTDGKIGGEVLAVCQYSVADNSWIVPTREFYFVSLSRCSSVLVLARIVPGGEIKDVEHQWQQMQELP